MERKHPKLAFLLALAALAATGFSNAARADEIRLKDGTKITGTIVGFENDSFRVETSYGFALIQKDKVADINITPTKKDLETKAKPGAATDSSASAGPASAGSTLPAPSGSSSNGGPNLRSPTGGKPDGLAANAAPTATPAVVKEPTAASLSVSAKMPAPERPAPPKNEPVSLKAPVIAAVPAANPAPVPPPAPPPAPEPVVIRDEIRGNLYVNLTYGFQMYKPPSWDSIPDARKALPDAVAALGTNDETTLLVIGREHTKDSLDTHAAATGKALSSVYDNYRLISNRQVSVAGLPAIEQRSRGTADGRDWSVTLLTFMKGTDAFTLLGMTWADSDLIQVEENVIQKTVNSLKFTP